MADFSSWMPCCNPMPSPFTKPIAMADGGVVVVETFGAVGSGSSTQPPVLVRVQTKLTKKTQRGEGESVPEVSFF